MSKNGRHLFLADMKSKLGVQGLLTAVLEMGM
jgi:hypothetical protein